MSSNIYYEKIWIALEKVADTYDKVTHSITFCLDDRFREKAIEDINGERVLDVGAGTGSLSKKLRNKDPNCYIVMLEPLRSFNMYLRKDKKNEVVEGVAEYLPFKKKAFDFVMSAYMLRDAMDLEKTIKNFEYVSNNLLILDFWKPDNALMLFMELLYMYTIMPILVLIHDQKRLKYYLALPYTVKKVPKLKFLIDRLNKIGKLKIKKFFKGIFFIVVIKVIDFSNEDIF